MKRVVAAIDAGPVSESVIAVADRLADVLGAQREIVMVDGVVPSALSPDVTMLEGDVAEALTALSKGPGVVALVVGIRAVVGGPRPAGHVTEELITQSPVPVVAVPPATGARARTLSRVLLPLEGAAPPDSSTEEIVRAFEAAGSLVDTVHVFDRASVPMFWDGWHDTEIWSEQFKHRYSPVATDTQLRLGDVAQQILGAAEENGSTLILLEWKCRLNHTHAPIVRELLSGTAVPLMLLPETQISRPPEGGES